jgi:bacillithiol system protein YtxJ
MPTSLQTLSTADQLERALDESARRPLVILKHSPTCGISAQAFESIADWLAGESPDADFYVLPVQAGRALSTLLSQRFQIRHESPQVMVIDRGEVAWHGSHFRATAGSIAAALDKLIAAT